MGITGWIDNLRGVTGAVQAGAATVSRTAQGAWIRTRSDLSALLRLER